MTDKPTNLLILMADEHTRHVLGCLGNRVVKTPNLDRLAARGTLFPNAYTPSPICVPARAAFATGQYAHVTGLWDNAFGYSGEPRGWGHALQAARLPVGSIGKLHYRREEDPTGLDFQILPMHLVDGKGDVLGAVRDPLPVRWKSRAMAEKIGPGETSYTAYDRDITEAAISWLQDPVRSGSGKPWSLFVSLVTPHFPLIAPQEFYDLYAGDGLMPAKPAGDNEHPWLAALRACFNYDNFTDERTAIALASYYGLVSFMDSRIGMILDALDAAGLTDTTRILYVSDHGDNIGERGLWGKSTMFEESAGIPAIFAGPGIPAGRICRTPVSLVDVAPTVLDNAGIGIIDTALPGRSLLDLSNAQDDDQRVVFSEYHAAGACSGAFMIRKGRWKYVHYVGLPPELYDLGDDPDELIDLGRQPSHAGIREELETELRGICDPVAVDRRARAEQAALVEANGGRDAVIARGGFGATPPPGEKPRFVSTG
jgi:choline-sulfatase